MKREMPKGRRALTASLIALALATGVAAFAIGVVLPALRAAEAEHQRAIRETPNYRPGYDPGPAVVDEAETAELEARVEQARRRADEAEAELARLKAAVAEKEAKEERLRQSKRRARTKPKSSQRRPEPRTLAEDPFEDPLTDWPFLD